MSDVLRIENHTHAFIYLFPTPSFPNGLRLVPGENDVPSLFMDEFQAHSVVSEAPGGKPGPVRYPGRDALAQLQEVVTINKVDGRTRGPRITIYTSAQAGHAEGPMHPIDLKAYQPAGALALIKVTTDKTALKRWSTDHRPAVAAAATSKLLE